VWAYEAIPVLRVEGIANKVKSSMPRMLGWKATDHPPYKVVKVLENNIVSIENNLLVFGLFFIEVFYMKLTSVT
jgi:hypothetical protein